MIEDNNTLQNNKNNEISILNKKVAELRKILHERAKTSGEMELLYGESNKKMQVIGSERNHEKNEKVLLGNKVEQVQSENRVAKEHISQLKSRFQQLEMHVKEKQQALEQLYQEFTRKEIEWASSLEEAENNMAAEFNAKLDEME